MAVSVVSVVPPDPLLLVLALGDIDAMVLLVVVGSRVTVGGVCQEHACTPCEIYVAPKPKSVPFAVFFPVGVEAEPAAADVTRTSQQGPRQL